MSSPHLNRRRNMAALVLLFALSCLAYSQEPNAVETFAARLSQAPSVEAGLALLAQSPVAVTAELQRAVHAQAEAHYSAHRLDAAAIGFALAQRIATQLPDQLEAARAGSLAWHRLGIVTTDQGRIAESFAAYRQALSLREGVGEPALIASTLNNLGLLHRQRGEWEEAAALLQRAFQLYEQAEKANDAASSLNVLASLAAEQNDFARATELYQQVLRRCELAPDDNSCRPRALHGLGAVAMQRGELDAALRHYQESLSLSEARQLENGVSYALNSLGLVAKQQGDLRHALAYFQRSLALKEKNHDGPGQAVTLLNLGQVYYAQNNLELARNYSERALQLAEKLGLSLQIVSARNNLALLHLQARRYAEAQTLYESNLALARAKRNALIVVESLNNLGHIQIQQARPAAAISLFQQALELAEQGHAIWRIKTLNNLSEAHFDARDYAAAVDAADRAAAAAAQADYAYGWARARAQAGAAHRALGDLGAARQALTESVDSLEKQRQLVAGDEQEQQRFLAGALKPFGELLAVHLAEGHPAEAFTMAERSKARSLLDTLRAGRIHTDKVMTAAERDEERRLLDEFTKCNAQLARARLRSPNDAARLAALQKQLAEVRLAQTEFQQRLYAAYPALALQRGTPPPFTLAQAGALLSTMPSGTRTALLEYAVTPERTYLFVMTQAANAAEPRLQVYELPITRNDLKTRVAAFRALLATRNLLFRSEAAALYELLLQPARQQLQGVTQLVIVPDASLWELPFQTLQQATQRYLIEDYALAFAPSLAVLAEMKRQRGKPLGAPTLLAFGNPTFNAKSETPASLRNEPLRPLPQAAAEVQAIAQLYGASRSRIYLGDEAREDYFKAEVGTYRIVHLASHSLLNDEQPMYSQIVLAQNDAMHGEDGLLEAWELARLDLHADLVVLSACETARGQVRAGEGMIGLSWALFVAGAPAAAVSQWQVDATSTTTLMVEFHRRLTQRNPVSKAAALRGATLQMLRGKYRHPFYWAGFVLVGDGF